LRDAKQYGFGDHEAKFDWKFFKEKRDAYVKRLNGIYERNLGNDKVEHFEGFASFIDKNTVRVQKSETESFELSAKKILIATGKEKKKAVIILFFNFFFRWSSFDS
jgi:glutathione reductase (NADPH)